MGRKKKDFYTQGKRAFGGVFPFVKTGLPREILERGKGEGELQEVLKKT